MIDTRVAKLEAHIEHIRDDIGHIKTDMRIVWGAIFLSALGLVGMMAKGFGWL